MNVINHALGVALGSALGHIYFSINISLRLSHVHIKKQVRTGCVDLLDGRLIPFSTAGHFHTRSLFSSFQHVNFKMLCVVFHLNKLSQESFSVTFRDLIY